MTWAVVGAALVILAAMLLGFAFVWFRRSGMSQAEAVAYLRELGTDLARLPRALRRLAGDPRTPRRARWALVALAIYIISPIDPIPDFLPGIGYLDEIILVPIVLRRIRRMIPDDLWSEYFPRD
jgi:uncharacterized membrane protein YkvA (DUF1232 family)